jgi:hypothetical protein
MVYEALATVNLGYDIPKNEAASSFEMLVPT